MKTRASDSVDKVVFRLSQKKGLFIFLLIKASQQQQI